MSEMGYKKTDDEWLASLRAELFRVGRESGTEPAF